MVSPLLCGSPSLIGMSTFIGVCRDGLSGDESSSIGIPVAGGGGGGGGGGDSDFTRLMRVAVGSLDSLSPRFLFRVSSCVIGVAGVVDPFPTLLSSSSVKVTSTSFSNTSSIGSGAGVPAFSAAFLAFSALILSCSFFFATAFSK